jgi:predicted dehydrogenase
MFIDSRQLNSDFPDNLAIIGGGRWARQIVEALCLLVPQSTRITLHSPRNSRAMAMWIFDRDLENRVSTFSCLPNFIPGQSNAAIVVNAASDHEASSSWVLKQECPVLVEKPLCVNSLSAQRIIDLALSKNVYLAAAHVFLFAEYMEEFTKLVTDVVKVIKIRVLWIDQHSENRYGEVKNYDAGLPVYADCLPHILSILDSFVATQDLACQKLTFFKGGRDLKINLTLGSIPCVIELVRNGNSRQRVIEVFTHTSKLTLDFSCEPGLIYVDDVVLQKDLNYQNSARPLTKMLAAFLKGAAGGRRDARLDSSIGLRSCMLIDQVASLYYEELSCWLNREFSGYQDCVSNDLRYALTELIQSNDTDSSISMDRRIDYIYKKIKERYSKFNEVKELNIVKAIKKIIKAGSTSSYL